MAKPGLEPDEDDDHRKVLMGGVWIHGTGSLPSAVQTALSSPYCCWLGGLPGVHEAPDDRRAHERDGERDEDEASWRPTRA